MYLYNISYFILHVAYCSSVLLNQKNGVTKFLQEAAGLDEVCMCTKSFISEI